MKIVNQSFISELLAVDIQIVNMAFNISEQVGIAALRNGISEFSQLLVRDVGSFINGMNIEYRSYLIGILTGIDDKYKESAIMDCISQKGNK